MNDTNPFTTAAREEAERQYWANPAAATSLPGYVGPFQAGAEWALALELAEEEVEAAARALALWDGADGWGTPGWDGEIPETSYVHGARIALSAARRARGGTT